MVLREVPSFLSFLDSLISKLSIMYTSNMLTKFLQL